MEVPLSKAKLSYLRKFRQKKFREQEDMYLIEGWHLLEDALESQIPLRLLAYDPSKAKFAERIGLLTQAKQSAEECHTASESQLGAIAQTETCQGVIAMLDRQRLNEDAFISRIQNNDSRRIVALDSIGDPGNCGTILRSCDWFGVDGMLFGKGCAELENGKTARAAMGSQFHVPVLADIDLPAMLQKLKNLGYAIIASALGSDTSLDGFTWPEKAVLVIGNEAHGISSEVEQIADTLLSIPHYGKAESLNAAMATSVMLANWRM